MLGGVLQMLTNFLALGDNTVSSCAPFLEHLLEALAAYTLPVAFKLADVVLNLPLGLLELVIVLNEDLTELTHLVGIYMN